MEKKCFQLVRRIGAAQEGELLRDYLRKELHLSHRTLSAIKYKGGKMLVDGREQTVRCVLHGGQELRLIMPPEEHSDFLVSEPVPLNIVYEDESFVVVNKQAGIPVIPSHQYPSGTLANGLLYYFEQENLASTVHIVNRLDRNTSGLMLVAKNRFSHERFFKMQKQKQIRRRYLALAAGVISPDKGMIDAPIGRKEGSAIERKVDWLDGRRSITEYKVLKRYTSRTLVAVRLMTGRTHQIRVHFSSQGHPLLGDDLYGGPTDQLTRQALHSFELVFTHPFTGQLFHLHAPLPADMAQLVGVPVSLDQI
jgi:23S rRNA pseudouridine1911/1915/1917 synthase